MANTPVRAIAARALVTVLSDAVRLNRALEPLMRAIPEPRDAALVQELCYGTLRFQPRLEFWLAYLVQQPLRDQDLDVHALLLLGLYQLSETRIPAYAAIKETAEACRNFRKHWAVKLVNAVLRRFQRERAKLQSALSAKTPEALYAHPQWFIDRVQSCWPLEWQSVLAAGNQRAPMTLRVNSRLVSRKVLQQEFASRGIEAQACDFSPDGLVLSVPLHPESLPGFSTGSFSVQDEGAQLAAELLDVSSGMRVLDACAAPGGKTCHLLERYPEAGDVLALDIDGVRADKIRENLLRLGLLAQIVVADAACPEAWWDHRCFERILLDAPCSASGVIRRHPDIKALRQPQDVAKAVALQARLLTALWPLLARGGKLLYVTCSVLCEENADQMRAFLGAHADAKLVELSVRWGRPAGPGWQILTGQNGMDGFYYACIEKL